MLNVYPLLGAYFYPARATYKHMRLTPNQYNIYGRFKIMIIRSACEVLCRWLTQIIPLTNYNSHYLKKMNTVQVTV